MGLFKAYKESYKKHVVILLLTKVLYYVYMLIIPMLVLNFHWWQILTGFFALHFTAGLLLAVVFQSAHVLEDTTFPLPDTSGNIENDWAIHQLYTTANFAPKSRLLSWLIGGLNYQIEHHLFPTICHVHYPKISEIVKITAQEFNFPYHSYPTFISVVGAHARMLKRLGRE